MQDLEQENGNIQNLGSRPYKRSFLYEQKRFFIFLNAETLGGINCSLISANNCLLDLSRHCLTFDKLLSITLCTSNSGRGHEH